MKSCLVAVTALFVALLVPETFRGQSSTAAAPEAVKTGQAAAPETSRAGQPAPPQSSAPWQGGYFPNVPVVSQDGQTFQFYDDLLKNKKVLIDFIYTRCTAVCPLQTAKLAQVQKLLGPRIGRDIFIYSISLDPEHDTPERLKAYAEKFHAGPGWLFLTGKKWDINTVRYKLGERSDKENHGNTVRVGDVARGLWMRIPLTADTFYVATEVGKTLDPDWYAGKMMPKIEEAPGRDFAVEDIPLLHGRDLFQNRCASCHTLGKGYLLGPDLKTVTLRRERSWLFRYIGAPDKMRGNQDPIAEELAKNNTLVMPNLGLDEVEVSELIAYLESRSGQKAELPIAQGQGAQDTAAKDQVAKERAARNK
ncbi:MAG TPA: SCO family protein [Candidatus Angelobacter sp.]